MKQIGYNPVKLLQSTLDNIKKSIEEDLGSEKESKRETEKEKKILNMLKNKKDLNFLDGYLNMDSQKILITNNVKKVVEYVAEARDYTWIMTIVQENSEVYCVINATKDLECSMIALSFLKELYNISGIIDQNKFIISGRDNWKKGSPMTELLDSMLRHIAALQRGEFIDPESGLSHIGHIQCNALFLGNPNVKIDIDKDNFNEVRT